MDPDIPPARLTNAQGQTLPRSIGKGIDRTRFLRGVQLTDRNGIVEFETLYPGWYYGRALHIHGRVHVGGAAAEGKYNGGHVAHTGQFYFPEDLTDQVGRCSHTRSG